MLYEKNDAQKYIIEFKKKFTNFAEKAPILLSYTTSPTKVQVVDEGTNTVYEFDWDFTISIKTFIHGIKSVLVENCYPILTHRQIFRRPLTPDEQVQLVAEGVALDQIPPYKEEIEIKKYLIDKVIVFKDIFIIKDLETGRIFRYKMNKSSVFFLQKLRMKKMSSEEAAEYFFQNSTLLNEIISMERG